MCSLVKVLIVRAKIVLVYSLKKHNIEILTVYPHVNCNFYDNLGGLYDA